MARWQRLAFVALLGAAALWMAMRQVEPRAFVAALSAVDPLRFALGITAFGGLHLVRAARFGVLVRAVRPTLTYRVALAVCSVGFLLINVLPFRLGEFARPLMLKEREDVPFGAGMAAVVVERVLDVLALGGLFAGALLFAEIPSAAVVVAGRQYDVVALARVAILSVLLPFGGGILLLVALGPRGEAIAGRAGGLFGEAPGRLAGRFVGTFGEGLRGLGTVRRGASVLGWTVLVWALNVLCIEFTANAFPFGAELGFWDAATVLVVLCVALIAPAPPGFAGVFELGCAIALTIYGVAPSEAAAFAVLLHGAQFALIAAFGLFFAATDNVALGKLARSAPERG